ncbi:MAG: terminase gpA endonuclease subunit [Deferribacterales bacterium]
MISLIDALRVEYHHIEQADHEIEEYFEAEYISALPGDDMTCSEWAERYRIVASGTSAVSGPWSNDLYPHTAGIMDALSSGAVAECMIVGGTQLSKTEVYNNYCGYRIHKHPVSIMLTMPTEDKAKELFDDRLYPMIRNAKDGILNKLCIFAGDRDLSYVNGNFYLSWATSASTLSTRPIEVAIIDEEDEMKPLKDYGHPVDLVRERLKASPNGILIRVGKPMSSTGIIAAARAADYMFLRYVPCPHCGGEFVFELEGLQPRNIPLSQFKGNAYYVCPHCEDRITERDRRAMLSEGVWRTNEGDLLEDVLENGERLTISFHISSFYAPFISFDEMLKTYLTAKSLGSAKLRVFYEGWLGINYDSISAFDEDSITIIFDRREDYTYELLPSGVCVLTAAVDVQANRLEVLIKGWGRNYENWHIRHEVISGSYRSNIPWDGLDRLLAHRYPHPCGIAFPVLCTVVDSSAFTEYVYKYTKPREKLNIFSVKGASTTEGPIVGKHTLAGNQKTKLYIVNVHQLKTNIFDNLRDTAEFHTGKAAAGVIGFMHYNEQCDQRYFEQLTSEKLIGSGKQAHYELIPGRRNEILDMTGYNEAALHISEVNINEMAELIRIKGGAA